MLPIRHFFLLLNPVVEIEQVEAQIDNFKQRKRKKKNRDWKILLIQIFLFDIQVDF